MENPNEDQDQMSTSSTLTGSSERSLLLVDMNVEFSIDKPCWIGEKQCYVKFERILYVQKCNAVRTLRCDI